MLHLIAPHITTHVGRCACALLAVALCARASLAQQAAAQAGQAGQNVVEVRIEGNRATPTSQVYAQLQTRAGRPYQPEIVQSDVRKLATGGAFIDVQPFYEKAPGGVVVIFRVTERPTLRYVQYLGNREIRDASLAQETGLKVGDPLDPYSIDEGRRKILEFYQSRGYNRAQVEVIEGTRPTDNGAVYVIHEGQAQKIFHVRFIGNTIAGDARLKTQIESKPGILWMFSGYVDRDKIDADIEKLTAYYRNLGFMQARIGRELEFSKNGWLTLTFVIHEGPRYRVRDVSFVGNQFFDAKQLAEDLKLKAGDYFDIPAMNVDVGAIRNRYGGQGFVFADVKASPRTLEGEPALDLVYDIDEGSQYRVGRINVHIKGENPHTRHQTVLNRLSFATGDVFDTRELARSRLKLRAADIFENDPITGKVPRIEFNPPDAAQLEQQARRIGGPRFQSPAPGAGSSSYPSASYPSSDYAGNQGGWGGQAIGDFGPGGAPGGIQPSGGYRGTTNGGAGGAYGGQPGGSSTYVNAGATGGSSYQNESERRAGDVSPPSFSSAGGAGYDVSAGSPGTNVPGSPSYAGSPSYDSSSDAFRPISTDRHAGSVPAGGVPARTAFLPSGADGQLPLYSQPYNPQPFYQPMVPMDQPLPELPVDIFVDEAQTGRLMLGLGINSDAGVVGSFTVDERNFDWRRPPTSLADFTNGTAWRGAGQRFRLELLPGTQVQRYLVSFQEPFLFDTNVSLGLSGFFFDRRYLEWDEQRLGGRVSLGYQLTPDLSTSFAYRGENVNLHDPAQPIPPEVAAALGDNPLHGFKYTVAHDTRDSAFLATEGHYVEASFEQVIGKFDYPRAELDARQYFLLHQRPDRSGRHVVSATGRVGFTGSQTPVFEHYFAGGFSTLRGFDFRGVGPRTSGIMVGGEFMLLGSLEYLFPITANDALRGVTFVDFGTVEREVEINDFRVAPGVGLRILVPALGPAPIALDFAFPVVTGPGDQEQVFSFNIGFLR